MKERYSKEIKTYIVPTIRIVEMSCEGMLCFSRVFMFNTYEDGGDIDMDFTMSF